MLRASKTASFFGQVIGQKELAGVELSETRYAALSELPEHVHRNRYLCFVKRGSFLERGGSRTTECRSGTLIAHEPGERHSNVFSADGGTCFNIQFGPNWNGRLNASWETVPRTLALAMVPAVTAALISLRSELDHHDAASALAIEGAVLVLMAELSRSATIADIRRGSWLPLAVSYLHDNRLAPFSLGNVAKAAGIHPVHLARSFKSQKGCTVGEYARRLRIAWACEALTRPTDTISQVAHSAGFADQSHFTRVFRRMIGCRPSEFRRRLHGSPGTSRDLAY